MRVLPISVTSPNVQEFTHLLKESDLNLFQVTLKESDPVIWVAAKKGVDITKSALHTTKVLISTYSYSTFKKELADYFKKYSN